MEIRLNLSPESTVAQLIQEDGTTISKKVSLGEVAGVFQSSVSFNWGLLPPNCRWTGMAGGFKVLALEVPKDKYSISTYDYTRGSSEIKVFKTVSLPAALFVFILGQEGEKFTVKDGFVFAMAKDRIIFSKDKLYHYPVPNVYLGDKSHKICWGDKFSAEMRAIAGAEGLVRTFYTSPFNYDLFTTDKCASVFPWNKIKNVKHVDEYFNLLNEEPEFKTEWLRPAGPNYETFEKAMQTIENIYK